MRIVTIIIFFAFIFSCSEKKQSLLKPIKFTKIDSLSGLNEIRGFIKEADSSLINFLCIAPNKYNPEYYSKSNWKNKLDSIFSQFSFPKGDFDNNGYTDLIITGEPYSYSFKVMAIMNFGKENYSVIPLTLSDINDYPIYPKLIYKNGIPVVELYSLYNFSDDVENDISKRTLIYKYDRFIDYNEPSEDYQISQIEFSSSACLGTCPVFELIINENSKSSFIAKYYNFSKNKKINSKGEEGYFETMINKENYSEICEIINYLQVKNLSDFYVAQGTDQPSCILRIHFNDGTVKTIEDYGKFGTNGLHFLYEKLSDLRFNQEWMKI